MNEVTDKRAPSDESFWSNVKKHFRKNRVAVYSLRGIYMLVILALIADFIANEKPLIARYKGETYFPVLKGYAVDMGLSEWPKDFQNIQWKDLKFDFAIFPPVPYLPKNIDYNNSQSVGPFESQDVKSWRWRHWLGTDELGHDVTAGMIHGTRIALTVGLVSMSIASVIGIFLGAMAGYYGDTRLKMSRGRIILNCIFLIMGIFYSFGSRSYLLGDALTTSLGSFFFEMFISLLILSCFMFAARLLSGLLNRLPYFAKKISVPVDIIVSRSIEIMVSIPTMFLIISIAAIVSKPSIYITMVIIGLTSWTGIARFIRAELLRVRNLEYIEAAHALGYTEKRTLLRHAIPNALSPVLISIAFGIASAILVESSLSFIGIGVPPETMTWGSLLAAARVSSSAWWLAVFPGFAIFITVTLCNLVGEGLTDALDPRLRK